MAYHKQYVLVVAKLLFLKIDVGESTFLLKAIYIVDNKAFNTFEECNSRGRCTNVRKNVVLFCELEQ